LNFRRIRKEKKSFEFEFIKKKFLSFCNPFVLFRCTWRGGGEREREKMSRWQWHSDACSHYFLSLIHVQVKEHSNHITFSSSWSWEFSSSKSCEKDMKEYGLSVITSFHLRLWYCWKNFINRRKNKMTEEICTYRKKCFLFFELMKIDFGPIFHFRLNI
jgi:hypothetical protein